MRTQRCTHQCIQECGQKCDHPSILSLRDNTGLMTDQTPTDDSTALSPEQAAADAAPQRFDTLPLDAKLLRAVADSGYTAMTPIQAKAIPIVLAGRDVMGAAVPGSTAPAAATTAARWQPHA